MIKPGYLEITDKVRFVFRELEKPNEDHYWLGRNFVKKIDITLDEAMKEYEASKRTVEVNNEYVTKIYPLGFLTGDERTFLRIKEDHINKFSGFELIDTLIYTVKNNQPCRAKVNGKAEIIKLL